MNEENNLKKIFGTDIYESFKMKFVQNNSNYLE